MTRNLYIGAELDPLLTASTLPDVIAAVTGIFLNVQSTNFPERADALADEVASTTPDLIGLQEVALWRTDVPADGSATPAETVAFDFLQIFLDALSEKGLHYAPAVIVPTTDVEAPTALNIDVRLTDREVILVRTDLRKADLKISNAQGGIFDNNLVVPSPLGGTVTIARGWASLTAKIRGKTFRFVSTHLDSLSPAVRLLQAGELLSGAAAAGSPVVLVGDFNSPPGLDPTYSLLMGSGFTDAWPASHPAEPGATCCQLPTLLNPLSLLSTRIDLVLSRGITASLDAEIFGDEPAERTASGLWPSDHAGLAATLRIR
jgi:endonuclease/exonuclease/phosphatase family metal-dependent hydrolase